MKIITVEQMDRGLAYAEACFETFRVIDGQIFDWLGHWRRLALGLSEFGLLLPPGQDEEVLFSCLKAAANVGDDALVRLTISGGESTWGLTCRGVSAAQIQAVPYAAAASPLFLRLDTWPFALQKKSAKFVADYADTLRALHGAADGSVLFEQNGLLLATATANILIYRDGVWHTPPDDAGVLPGRVRDFMIRRGLLHEVACPLAWLQDCEAFAVCNSGLFIRPVAWIEGVERATAMAMQHASLKPLQEAMRMEKGVPMDINAW